MMKVCVVLACLLATAFGAYVVVEQFANGNCGGAPAYIEAYESGACVFGEVAFTCNPDGTINVQAWEQLGLCMDVMNHTSNNITNNICLPYPLDPTNLAFRYTCVEDFSTIAPERLRAQLYMADACPGNPFLVSWEFTDVCLSNYFTNTSQSFVCAVNGTMGSRTTCNDTMCTPANCSTLPLPTDFCIFVDDVYVKAFCPSVAPPAGTTGAVMGGTTGAVMGSTTGAIMGATTGIMAATGTTGAVASTTGAVAASTTGAVAASTTGSVAASTTGVRPSSTTGSNGSTASSVAVSFLLVAAMIAALL